jgi:hypothetical protein
MSTVDVIVWHHACLAVDPLLVPVFRDAVAIVRRLAQHRTLTIVATFQAAHANDLPTSSSHPTAVRLEAAFRQLVGSIDSSQHLLSLPRSHDKVCIDLDCTTHALNAQSGPSHLCPSTG